MFKITRDCLQPRRLVWLALVVLAVTLSHAGYPQVARMEVLTVQSTTSTDQAFLVGGKAGKPTSLAGELRLPRTA